MPVSMPFPGLFPCLSMPVHAFSMPISRPVSMHFPYPFPCLGSLGLFFGKTQTRSRRELRLQEETELEQAWNNPVTTLEIPKEHVYGLKTPKTGQESVFEFRMSETCYGKV
jgi:hypothetical protein